MRQHSRFRTYWVLTPGSLRIVGNLSFPSMMLANKCLVARERPGAVCVTAAAVHVINLPTSAGGGGNAGDPRLCRLPSWVLECRSQRWRRCRSCRRAWWSPPRRARTLRLAWRRMQQ